MTTNRPLITRFDPKAAAAQQARIIEAIKLYQSKHRGLSPTDQMLAQEVGLSPGQVSYHISILENDGKLFVASRWPRSIVFPKGEEAKDDNPRPANETDVSRLRESGTMKTEPIEVVGSTMEEKMHDPIKVDAAGRVQRVKRKPLRQRAKEVAQALCELEQRGEKGGALKLAQMVYGREKDTGNITRVVKHMVEKGWASHRLNHPNDTTLTTLGKEQLLGIRTCATGPRNRWARFTPEERSAYMRDLVNKRYEKEKQRREREQPPVQTEREVTDAVHEEHIMPELRLAHEETLVELAQRRQPTDHKVPAHAGQPRNTVRNTVMVPVEAETLLSSIDTLDLVLELTNRGFKVTRA